MYRPDPARGAEWNRGAYLVRAVAHCGACHEARNALGAVRSRQDGPYYPSLRDDQIADVLTYVRTSWGNSAPPVLEDHVAANRGNPLW